jgi:hypothetical protein
MRKSPATETPQRIQPAYKPEPESAGPATSDLFAIVKVIDPPTLLDRLLQLGVDIYCGGPFESLKDRLRYVIVDYRAQRIVCGRHPETGKVENVAEAFCRVTGEPLEPTKKKRA